MRPKDKLDFIIKIISQKKQFEDWLMVLFYLNYSLDLKFDSVYISSYYVKIYEILTVGLTYAKNALELLRNTPNKPLEEWYYLLVQGLVELKDEISEKEFEFIEFKRHHACHIFQNAYEIQFNEKDLIKRNNRVAIKEDFIELIAEHRTEENFDNYLFKKLNPKIVFIFKQLENK